MSNVPSLYFLNFYTTFCISLFLLITFGSNERFSGLFVEIEKSEMASAKNRDVIPTTSSHFADSKENCFRRTFYAPGLIIMASTYLNTERSYKREGHAPFEGLCWLPK